MIFFRSASSRYGRHKVIAALVTFAVLWIVLKVLFPDGALEGILRGMVRSTPTPEKLFAERTSDVALETIGVVEAVLADSLLPGAERATLQRVRFRSDSGHPLTLVHDLAVAPRVALAAGDSVSVRGRYLWTTGGGLLVTVPQGGEPGFIQALGTAGGGS